MKTKRIDPNKLLPNASSISGASMGRRNHLPADPAAPIRLRLVRLEWVDGDYDRGGAYWGHGGNCESIYWAFAADVDVFVRAGSRAQAKAAVREEVPGATFYGDKRK